ncbi:TIGR03435 family protein [Terriglobus albidus]|uniref:TIGR03435 family protein n=1 Tax=Terriglobus albidus TaxID=1592106 RepID=A0A5B9EGL9_9BACT|nr:TIGR03435 family protein [Terriglobus albidus]QEE30285.1 TIGR03435 family protein [Terriglobus albidus]
MGRHTPPSACRWALIALSALPLVLLHQEGRAQSPSAAKQNDALRFDVASIRENKSPDGISSNVPLGPGNVYSPTGGLFLGKNIPLLSYIAFAYRMTDGQLTSFRAMAPEWVRNDRFDIQARTDKNDVTKDELRLMMRSLLKERFNLAVHYESREVTVYALKQVKPGQTGPKLQPHPANSPCPTTLPDKEPTPPSAGNDGLPETCGGILLLPASAPHRFNLGGRNVPISLLANSFTGWGALDHPVVDQTGLSGGYDFTLEYTPDPTQSATSQNAAEDSGPMFREALKQQLGLKLESEKSDIQVIILDHIDHVTDN